MIKKVKQWHDWIEAIQNDLAKCEIDESLSCIGNKVAALLGYESEEVMLNTTPLNIDFFPSIARLDGDLETAFHTYVNRNSYTPTDDPFAPTKLYYPPCRKIMSLLPEGIELSPNVVEWYWVHLVMNSMIDTDGEILLPRSVVKEHKGLKLTTADNGRFTATGDIDEEVIKQVNEACLMVSRGRFEPFIIANR